MTTIRNKKIKIYKAFPAYDLYLNDFYQRNVILKSATFEVQKKALMNDYFPWIFSWTNNIHDKDIEIFETVHNSVWLQRAWNNRFNTKGDWQFEIVLKQIKKHQPHICVLYPPEYFDEIKLQFIRENVKHDLVIAGYDGMHRKKEELYKGYDLIITCSDVISDYYKLKGIDTVTVNFGFDKEVFTQMSRCNAPKYDIGFSGSVNLFSKLHTQRYELLKFLTKKVNIAIRSDFCSNRPKFSLTSRGQLKRLIKDNDISNYFALWRIAKKNMGPVFGINMFQFLSESKISLNMHGDDINFAANVRLFEITGIGSCMLTDWKNDISNFFNPNKEIMTYQSIEEAYHKIKFLLNNDSFRQKVASAGQEKTLKCYTYDRLLAELVIFLRKNYLN